MPSEAKKTLKNLAGIHYGKSPKGILADDGHVPVIGTGGVERYGTAYLYDGESIVLGRKGTIDNPIYVDGKFWAIDTTFYLRDFNETDVKWLYYFLRTINFHSMSEATGVPSLSRDFLYSIEVNAPSKVEQTQIAAVLSCIDRAIEHTEALIAKQQRIKTGLMQDLLTKGIDEHGNIRSEATHEFKDSPLGRIPKEWKVENLGAISTKMTNGFVGVASPFYTDNLDGIPYLMSNNVRANKFDLRKLIKVRSEFHARQKKSVLAAGDMLTVQSGHIGTTCIVTPVLENSNCHALIITRFKNPTVVPYFIAFYINSDRGMSRLSDIFIGSTIKHINVSDFACFLVPLPSMNEQEEIIKRIRRAGDLLDAEHHRLLKLQKIKTGLMHDLLTGEISTNKISNAVEDCE
ncbi:MAG: restriction endonuclease subunit S [Pyrinomonadaceae bacterium]